MQSCGVDFSPIILAIAAVISLQVPLLVGHFINTAQTRHDARTIKTVTFDNNKKLDQLENIAKNGFYQQSINYSTPSPPPQVDIKPPIE